MLQFLGTISYSWKIHSKFLPKYYFMIKWSFMTLIRVEEIYHWASRNTPLFFTWRIAPGCHSLQFCFQVSKTIIKLTYFKMILICINCLYVIFWTFGLLKIAKKWTFWILSVKKSGLFSRQNLSSSLEFSVRFVVLAVSSWTNRRIYRFCHLIWTYLSS